MLNTIDFTLNGSTDSSRGPSDSIWGDYPALEIAANPGKGMHLFDDFVGPAGLITSPTTEAALVGLPYSGFGSSGATITAGTALGGEIILTEATDNEGVYLQSKARAFQISASTGKFWFEARVKVSAITNNQIGFLLGMFDDTAVTIIVPLSTANPPIFATTGNFVGFWGREEDAGAVRTTYVADGVTSVVVQAAVHQFVADTYVKLGMKFEPAEQNKLSFFVNGVKQSSTKTVPSNTGTDFPADVRLSPIIGHRLGASTSSLTTLDWWRAAQLFV